MLGDRGLSPKTNRRVGVTAVAVRREKSRLLAALPGPDRQRLLARCPQVELRLADV